MNPNFSDATNYGRTFGYKKGRLKNSPKGSGHDRSEGMSRGVIRGEAPRSSATEIFRLENLG